MYPLISVGYMSYLGCLRPQKLMEIWIPLPNFPWLTGFSLLRWIPVDFGGFRQFWWIPVDSTEAWIPGVSPTRTHAIVVDINFTKSCDQKQGYVQVSQT